MQEVPAFESPISFSALSGISIESVLSVIFTLVFIWWIVYTVVAIYHWVRFGRASWAAVPAVALHLAVSGGIIVFMTSGLQ